MANTANLHCIRKNIGYVCADGFWSSAEILENSLVLAKMQILQNARWVWLRAGVFAIHFEHMGKEHRPRRRGLKARSNASLSLTNVRELLPQPLWRCPDRLPSLRFRGFSNPFLKIGVRGGDSGAEPPAVEVSCLL